VLRRLLLVFLAAACSPAPGRAPDLRLWHTFNADETALLNEALAEIREAGGPTVAAVILPFGQAQNRLRHALAGAACPDLARIDATWLPALAAAKLLAPAPPELVAGHRTAARELVAAFGESWGIPQSLDGLVLLYDPRLAAQPAAPASLDALEAQARAAAPRGGFGLSLRADGYWFLALVRAEGGDLADATGDAGLRALRRWVGWERSGLVPLPEPGGDEGQTEARRFAAGELAFLVGGPWTVAALRRAGAPVDPGVLPLPGAPPVGGHVYVVPRCARHPAQAWALADRLTAAPLQIAWSRRLGVVPTREAALAEAGPLARAFDAALQKGRTLPRDAATPSRFDDLTPAVEAALLGDATPEEALAGVTASWSVLP